MAKDLQFRRQVLKRSTVPGQVPTIPLTNDHTDGTWLVTDIYEGEFFLNIPDGILYTRVGSTILNLTAVSDESVVATMTVGGILIGSTVPVGTTLTNLIKLLIAPYIKPSFNSLVTTFSPVATYFEVGQIVDVVAADWNNVNDSEGHPSINMNLAGDGFNKAVTGHHSDSNPASTSQLLIEGLKTWTLTGKDKNAVAITPITYTKGWRFKYWFGATAAVDPISDPTATALVLALQQYQFLTSRGSTFICTADNNNISNYTWIAYKSSYGALTNILQDGSYSILGAFTLIGIFNITNAQGIVEAYRLYKSNAPGAFGIGAELEMS